MASPSPEQPPQQRRTWPQRLTIFVVCIAAFACFTAAGVLAGGQWVLSQRNLAPLAQTTSERSGANQLDVVGPDTTVGAASEGDSTATLPTLPASTIADAPLVLAEPDAANFLVVGADNGDCAGDPLIEDRSDLGERSDTIMVWRANPKTNELAVLSFPRDLYVEFPSGRKNRINAAFKRDDPSELQEVLNLNFGVQIDHYIQIDFCAFRRLVQAVGGVEIPFQYPARDKPSNGNPPLFLVDQTGCVNLDGDQALAYVRSRHYQYVRLRPHFAPAGLPAPRAQQGDQRRSLRPRRGASPDHCQPELHRHRSRPHRAPDARVRQRAQEFRSRIGHDLSDRFHAAHHV